MAMLDFVARLGLDKDPPTPVEPLPVTAKKKEKCDLDCQREKQRMEQMRRFMEDRGYPLNKPKGTLDHAFWHEAACSAAEQQAAEVHAEGSRGAYGAIGAGSATGFVTMVEGLASKVLGGVGIVITGALSVKSRHDDDFAGDRQADASRCRATK